jgi:DNA-binding NarL/FixJ family response regulator
MGSEQKPISTLIAARPDPNRIGLQTVLSSFPNIQVQAVVSDCTSLEIALLVHKPEMAVLDINLSEAEVERALLSIKSRSPNTFCLVMIERIHQEQFARQAGADQVLLKGFRTEELENAIHLVK